jgi:hypothetical protein
MLAAAQSRHATAESLCVRSVRGLEVVIIASFLSG